MKKSLLILFLLCFGLSSKAQSSCPDNNHPHMIDLGLPSGTLWACCNVGSSSPEDYGVSYAWGETETKSEYDYTNYAYGNDEYTQNIGKNIAGTKYDVAHVKWGGSWRMPSMEQIEELTNNCTSKWMTKNGTNGRLCIGPNGQSIFLPAAHWGFYNDNYEKGGENYAGTYWSSTQDTLFESHASVLYYNCWDRKLIPFRIQRYLGASVRPVCPPKKDDMDKYIDILIEGLFGF